MALLKVRDLAHLTALASRPQGFLGFMHHVPTMTGASVRERVSIRYTPATRLFLVTAPDGQRGSWSARELATQTHVLGSLGVGSLYCENTALYCENTA